MSFDQGEFNFDAKGSEAGYRKWSEKLEAKQRAFESRWGVILSRPVRVCLTHHAKPLTGILNWRAPAKGSHAEAPVFILKGLEFTPQEIESIVQVDAD